MDEQKVFGMKFAKLYPLLVEKARSKGRTRQEVDEVTGWLTGYDADALERLLSTDVSYGDFFRQAPRMNPDRELVSGSICGHRIEEIQDPLMREIRRLDKLVDELARGKPMEKILRKR